MEGSQEVVAPVPPARRRAPPPVILASEPTSTATPTPPPRRRAPPAPVAASPEPTPQRPESKGRFYLEGFNRPLPIYWQHHGAPDYVKRHAEELMIYRKAVESGNEKRIEDISDMMIVNIYMYEDALRRFFNKPYLTDEQFARLEREMIGAFDNTTKGGCHRDIINLDGKNVLMRWHTGSGEVTRDSVNAIIYFDLLK